MERYIGEFLEGTVDALAFGGEGIVRQEGFVVFIPFVAIGDHLRYRLTEVKKSFARGVCLEVLQPGPHRTIPRCPYFGICGGCQLQHLDYTAQMSYKHAAVVDALKRIGHLTIPQFDLVPAHLQWAYRRHITLHLIPKAHGFAASYIGIDHHSPVTIATCPIFNEADDKVIEQLQTALQHLPHSGQQNGRLTVMKNQRGQYVLYLQFESKLKITPQALQTFWQAQSSCAGLLVDTKSKSLVFGDPYCELEIDKLRLRFTPQTFVQNHPEQSATLYREILTLVNQKPNRRILDLYCGFGVTSLLLAHSGHNVTAIEVNAESIALARGNANDNNTPHIQFVADDVARVLPDYAKEGKTINMVLLNPPRTGLSKEIVQALLKIKPAEILYVSCLPATLARDLAQLDYKIRHIRAFDMFPQTAHVETLVHLESKNGLFS